MRIKVKIPLIIIISLVLVLFASTYYSQKIIEKSAESSLKDDISRIVKQVDLSLVTAKKISNVKLIDENLKELMLVRPSVVRIDIFSFQSDGTLKRLISKTRRSIPQTKLTQEDIDKAQKGQISLKLETINNVRYINVIAPIHFNERVFGLIELKRSRKEFDNFLAKRRKHAFFITIISAAFITIVLIISISKVVLRPIQEILKAISKVKTGDLGASVPLKKNDEIGNLTESFNTMVQTIKKNTDEKESLIKQIHFFNEQLQSKVLLATEELRDAHQSIYKMQKQLGHTRRLAAVGELAAMVAHELGTPLHSISGHLQLLKEEADLPQDGYRRIKIMQSQLERVIKSIQRILDTTRPPDTCSDWTDLNQLLEDVIILVFPETLSKQITIKKEFQQTLPKIFGSCSQLQEALLNLIDNAIDASTSGGTISIITECLEAHKQHHPLTNESVNAKVVQISIKDNGKGISSDCIKHIFEPFFTTKGRGHGTGLGLAISQEIIHRHYGTISVESKINEGSIFRVQFPLKKDA